MKAPATNSVILGNIAIVYYVAFSQVKSIIAKFDILTYALIAPFLLYSRSCADFILGIATAHCIIYYKTTKQPKLNNVLALTNISLILIRIQYHVLVWLYLCVLLGISIKSNINESHKGVCITKRRVLGSSNLFKSKDRASKYSLAMTCSFNSSTESVSTSLSLNLNKSMSYYIREINYSYVLSQIQLGIIIIDREFCLAYANPKGKYIISYSKGVMELCHNLRNCINGEIFYDDLCKFMNLPTPKNAFKDKYYLSFDKQVASTDTCNIFTIEVTYIELQDLFLLIVHPKENTNLESNSISKNLKEITSCSLFHELYNLGNGIIGNAELLEESILPDKKEYYHNLIIYSKILCLRLRDIDDFIKISYNKFRLHVNTFNIRAMLEENQKIIAQFCSLKNICFSLLIADDTPTEVLSDKERILQVLMNTLYSIIEKISSGIISLKIARVFDPFIEMMIIVKTHERKKIESMFESIQNYKSTNQSSITNIEGISLVSSSIIAQTFGNGIELTTRDGNLAIIITIKDGFNIDIDNDLNLIKNKVSSQILGRKFSLLDKSNDSMPIKSKTKRSGRKVYLTETDALKCIKLELNEIQEIPEEFEEKQKSIKISKCKFFNSLNFGNNNRYRKCNTYLCEINMETTARTQEDEKIFNAIIVDDNDVNLFVLSSMLKGYNIFSLCNKDGQESINTIQTLIKKNILHHIKIIFMDMQMPIMNGMEATQKILNLISIYGIRKIPIIGVSSNNNEEDRKAFISSGINEFAQKPVNKNWLKGILTKYGIIKK